MTITRFTSDLPPSRERMDAVMRWHTAWLRPVGNICSGDAMTIKRHGPMIFWTLGPWGGSIYRRSNPHRKPTQSRLRWIARFGGWIPAE